MTVELIIFIMSIGIFYFILFYYPRMIQQQQISQRLLSLRSYKFLNSSTDLEEEMTAPGIVNRVLRHLFDVFKKFNMAELATLQHQPHRSGWHSKKSVALFILIKLLSGGLASVGTLVTIMSQNIYLPPLSFLLSMMIAILTGFLLPNYFLEFFIKRRQKILEEGIPDMIDILVICTDAGLGLDATLERVSKELRTINKPLSEELALTVLELSYSADRRHALTNLSNRLNIKGITVLTSVFIQSEQYGTTLAQTLKDCAQETRQERILAAEAKAAQLPAILTLPLIIFIMPCLFIILLTPIILQFNF